MPPYTSTLRFIYPPFRSVVLTTNLLRLKTWSRREGNIRLSEDDGPSAESFLEDTVYDADNNHIEDSDELAVQKRIERMRQQQEGGQGTGEHWQEVGPGLRTVEANGVGSGSTSPFSVGDDVEGEDESRRAWESHKRGASVSSEATVRG